MKRLIVATLALLTLTTTVHANTVSNTVGTIAKPGIVQEKKKKKTTGKKTAHKKTSRKKAHSGQKKKNANPSGKSRSLPHAAPVKTTGKA